ncbi:MAG TPA: beta-ketoacyl-ACP synthase III [Gemmataceae bacterium]
MPRTALRAVLAGTGSCLPPRAFHNDQFPPSLETSDEWIHSRTGIRERRVAADGETTSTLGLEAARRAVQAAGLTPDAIDLIVCATVTADVLVPSVAARIQAGLGCRTIPSFDLNAACTGFLYAVTVAEQFLRAGTARHALVVGVDTLTRVTDFADRNSCILFGDGAGAVVLSAEEGGRRGLRFNRLYADGSDMILLKGVGSRPAPEIITPPPATCENTFLRLNGREVFKFAVTRVRQLFEEVLRACELQLTDIDLIIPHQVNQRILDTAFEGLGVPPERVMVNLDRYGNTSAASVPIALDDAVSTGRAKAGDTVLLMAFGGGMTWGGTLLTL